MKRGLTQTLMTVAIALLGYQALAMAPVIGEIPSPVVGNKEATPANGFVFPDAIALDSYVTDDNTAAADIKWYYRVEGTQIYMLNGVDSLSAGESAALAADLPEGKRIDNQVLKGELNNDTPTANPRTVTVRNIHLSPFAPATGAQPSGSGQIDSQVVTLYASDGTTYSTKGVMIYSENNANDHYAVTLPFVHPTFNGTTEGFTYVGQYGSVTSNTSNNTSLCFNITGMSMATYIGPWGLFTIDQNSVYKIRANMNSSQATGGKTPFWDMIVDNFQAGTDTTNPTHADRGLGVCGADMFILDNASEGSADAVISKTAGTDFLMYFAPICVDTNQWKNGYAAANSANADNMKARIQFRTMDVRTDLGAANAAGMLCLTDMDITKYPVSSMTTVGSPLYNVTNFKINTATGGNTAVAAAPGLDQYMSTLTWSTTDGSLTLTPTANSKGTELTTICPATSASYTPGQSSVGNWFPVLWESDTLYMISYTLAAPSSGAEANPFDAIYIGVDTPSNEVLMETFITTNGGKMAMPKATAQTYKAFWGSNKVSKSTNPFYDHFRPRLTVVNNSSFNAGDNSGGLKITGCKVEKVSFQ